MKIQNSELRQAQIKEAVLRMTALNLLGACVREFQNTQAVMYSVPTRTFGPLAGTLFSQTKNAPEAGYIEAATAALLKVDPYALPYHAEISKASFGTGDEFILCNLLYVSSHKEDWEVERPMEGCSTEWDVYCWAYNVTDPELSDFGTCVFVANGGGLARIA